MAAQKPSLGPNWCDTPPMPEIDAVLTIVPFEATRYSLCTRATSKLHAHYWLIRISAGMRSVKYSNQPNEWIGVRSSPTRTVEPPLAPKP